VSFYTVDNYFMTCVSSTPFSLIPPTGKTLPVSDSSPVMAMRGRNGVLVAMLCVGEYEILFMIVRKRWRKGGIKLHT